MKINKEWHEQNRMPPKAPLEERLQWHLEHEKNCNCRPIPPKLRQEMIQRGLLEK